MFENECILVPLSLQKTLLVLIDESHLGMEKCKTIAGQFFYWPHIVSNCAMCCNYKKAHPKEPIISHSITSERFLNVGMDIMTFRNTDYLVVVDYFSKYPKVTALPEKNCSVFGRAVQNHFCSPWYT